MAYYLSFLIAKIIRLAYSDKQLYYCGREGPLRIGCQGAVSQSVYLSSQSVCQVSLSVKSVSQTVSQPVKSVSQSISQSVSQSVNQSVSQSVSQSVCQSVSQSVNLARQSVCQVKSVKSVKTV